MPRRCCAPWTTCILLAVVASACTDADTSRISRRTIGDTTVITHRGADDATSATALDVVATVGAADGSDSLVLGSLRALAVAPDGRILALDGDGPMVRVFTPALVPMALWSRRGAGPGELANPDGGLAVLRDGRTVIRDPGNARLLVLDSAGRPLATWPVIDPGLRTRDNFGRSGDTLLSRVVVDASGPIESWRYGYARIVPPGTILDTVLAPIPTERAPTLVARRGGSTAELPVPWAPTTHIAWHPVGGFARADGSRYAVTWPTASGWVRVERVRDGAPIAPAERAQARDEAVAGMQWLDPAWRWTGPEIPARKPAIGGLWIADDGRVGVLREGPALAIPTPEGDTAAPARRWTPTWELDLYRADGAMQHRIALPVALQLRPAPVLLEDGLVGLTIETDGIPRLVRYRFADR